MDVVDLSIGKKPVGCKWVLTIKYKVDGIIERYKVRLVGKGYIQTWDGLSREIRTSCKNEYNAILLSLFAHFNLQLQ